MKKKQKRKSPLKKFLAVCCPVVAVLLVVNILALNVFFDLLNIVMPGGGMRALYADGIEASYVSDFTSKEEALEHANELNVDLCREGFVLLKTRTTPCPSPPPSRTAPSPSGPKSPCSARTA